MVRVLCVVLTVAAILACRLECMPKFGAEGTSGGRHAEDFCCEHHYDLPAEQGGCERLPVDPLHGNPSPPEGCNGNCMCNGAVEVSRLALPEQSVQVAWLDLLTINRADAAASPFASPAEDLPHPRHGSGRMRRLVLASLLL